MSHRLVAAGALALALAGCPGRPKAVVYDLAARVAVAETWSGDDVLRFGTPAAEPRLTDGFHRESGGAEEPFLWSKGEAEVAFQWDAPTARVAILDAAPYREVKDPAVEVRLNDTVVERFKLNDARHRYRIGLPAAAQKAGDNRLRFVFAGTASPAEVEPASLDKRQLGAAFYTLVTGPSSDASPRPPVSASPWPGSVARPGRRRWCTTSRRGCRWPRRGRGRTSCASGRRRPSRG